MNDEQKQRIEDTLSDAFTLGQISRRQFIQGLIATGLGMSGAAILAACGAPATPPRRPPLPRQAKPAPAGLTPTFYQWIVDLHPGVPEVNDNSRPELPDCAGGGIRCRALCRRRQEQAQHLGCVCRDDAVCGDGCADQGRRHRAVGQLHSEGCA